MSQIKCPQCGTVFQVDESGYAQILSQVRDAEFAKELSHREQLMEKSPAAGSAACDCGNAGARQPRAFRGERQSAHAACVGKKSAHARSSSSRPTLRARSLRK